MEFKTITSACKEWPRVAEYAQNCSWRAGKALADDMLHNRFTDWERVIVATEEDSIAGYCTVAKTDCIPHVTYSPYIGFLFVDEKYRGSRLSQKLIAYAMEYLKELGFKEVYLVSDHNNLYEKYGFEVIDKQVAPWGKEEKIYRKKYYKRGKHLFRDAGSPHAGR